MCMWYKSNTVVEEYYRVHGITGLIHVYRCTKLVVECRDTGIMQW